MSTERPGLIPPPSALAFEGAVHPGVAATLRRAREIRDGWGEALSAARAELTRAHRARLRRAIGALHRWAGRERRRLAGEAIELALELALELAGEALARAGAEERARALLSLAAARICALGPPAAWLVLRVHPSDAQALGSLLDGPPEGIRVLPDAALQPGDLVLEGPAGRVDARLATRALALIDR